MKTVVFPGDYSSLDEIRTFFTAAGKEAGLEPQTLYDIELAADEAASNIIDHAYGGEGKGKIECSYRILEDRMEIFLKDFGKPFNPESIEPPNVGIDPCDRPPSGLGLYFMQKLMDKVIFSFNGDGGNVLKMVKMTGKYKINRK